MVAQPTSSIHAERYEKRMPVGSYQLRLESPQHDSVVYPFNLTMGQTGTAANLEPLRSTNLWHYLQRVKLVMVTALCPKAGFM